MILHLPRLKARRGLLPIDKHPAIGEQDAQVFTCPGCSRPLPNGTWRCPGCGVVLVLGVMLRRALGILGVGVVLGAVVAGSLVLALTGLVPASNGIAADPGVSGATGAQPSAIAEASNGAPVLAPNVPQTAVGALSGTAVVNARLVGDAATLTKILARKGDTTAQIERQLRALGADAAQGIDMTGRMAGWADAAVVRKQLTDFYTLMADTARDGLRASLTDRNAYRSAAWKMLSVVKTLAPLDAGSRSLAGSVNVILPSIGLPGA